MTLLAAVRPEAWNLPLFLHVLGAMTLVGGLALAATALAGSWRGAAAAPRLGYRALLLAALPGWVAMRASAQWLLDEEGLSADSDVAWIEIGFGTSEPLLLFLVGATVLAGIAARRSPERARTPARTAAGLVGVLLVAYVVAIWAMTAKPG